MQDLDKILDDFIKDTIDACDESLQESLDLVTERAKEKCPVRTGVLRDSIHNEIEEGKGYIVSDVDYAPFVEYGTVKMAAQPFIRSAIDESQSDIDQIYLKNIGSKI